MTDLSDTIAAKSQQLNADDLLVESRTIKIRAVKRGSGQEQPIAVYYEGDDNKPWYPCKGMRRVMVDAWGPKGDSYVGKSMTLFRDPRVKYGGIEVGGIRISHMSDLPRDRLKDGEFTVAIAETRGARKPYTVRPLQVRQAPARSEPAADLEALKQRARSASQQGTETFRGFWTESLTKEQRQALADELPKLKEAAAEADRKGAPTEADPFTVPGDDVRLDQDGEIDDGTGDVIDDQPREREPGEEG